MKALVTGANGMLGQDLCPILDDMGIFVIQTDIETLDITDEDKVNTVITNTHPDLVIHTAAYTNVDKAEEDAESAYKINYEGSKNIAKACNAIDIPMILISTDYVFDGTKTTPYTVNDKPNPISIYGKSKHKAEETVIKNCKKYYIARTSWLYGLKGKNFIETMLGLKDKPEICVVNDQTGSPTWSVDLASNILKLLSKPYGIYHLSSEGETTWYDFAVEIFRTENIKVNIKPITSPEFGSKAKRPKYSTLENNGIVLSDWKVSLKNYLKLRRNA